MIRYEITDFGAADWNRRIAATGRMSLLQSWEYGSAKAQTPSWRVERGVVRDGADDIAFVQALIRATPFGLGGFTWINRAPVLVRPDYMPDAIDAVIRHYAQDRNYYVRVAPPLEASVKNSLPDEGRGYRTTAVAGWASGLIDLTQPEDTLFAGLRGNWRNSVRKAERSGVTLEIGSDDHLFQHFLEEQSTFLAERGFATSVRAEFLQVLQALMPPERKMIVLAAFENGLPVGSVLVARYGDACEYLAGNSRTRAPGLGVGQLLLWQAIVAMKQRGCTKFDLGGMEPGVTPKGIYDFKAGVNPVPYRYVNEVESRDHGLSQRLVRAYVLRKRGGT